MLGRSHDIHDTVLLFSASLARYCSPVAFTCCLCVLVSETAEWKTNKKDLNWATKHLIAFEDEATKDLMITNVITTHDSWLWFIRTDFFSFFCNLLMFVKRSYERLLQPQRNRGTFRLLLFITNTYNNLFWTDASYKMKHCVSIAAASASELDAYSRKLARLAEGHRCQWTCGFFTRHRVYSCECVSV